MAERKKRKMHPAVAKTMAQPMPEQNIWQGIGGAVGSGVNYLADLAMPNRPKTVQPTQFVPPNQPVGQAQTPGQFAGIELDQPVGGMPFASPGQGVPPQQYQGAIGSAGDLSLTQGKVTAPPAPQTLDTAGGQYQRSVTPGGGIEWSGPQGTASYDATAMGQDVSAGAYNTGVGGGGGEISSGLMAEANKNMREGRRGQGSFGIAAPGTMGAMAGANGYASSTPEGQNNAGNRSGSVGGAANVGGTDDSGAGADSRGENLAEQQARIETMKQWQSMDPSERGKMPQRVRDAFGLGPEPETKAEAPQRTQEYQRQLDMRNAGVGIDTAHGPNSPWANPEGNKQALARQAAVGQRYADEDKRIADFEGQRAGLNVDKRGIEADTALAEKEMQSRAQQKELDRQAGERIANIQQQPREKYAAKSLREFDDEGAPTGERLGIYSTATGELVGQQGIEGPQPQTEEAFINHMATKFGIKKGDPEYEEYLADFRKRQGLE